jgi:hypothetical protein
MGGRDRGMRSKKIQKKKLGEGSRENKEEEKFRREKEKKEKKNREKKTERKNKTEKENSAATAVWSTREVVAAARRGRGVAHGSDGDKGSGDATDAGEVALRRQRPAQRDVLSI